MPPRFSPSWSSNMSINIRRNLLVVAGTFLFKVINIEKNTKWFLYYITYRYIALWTGWTDVHWNLWVEPAVVISFDRIFWRGGEGRMPWCTIFWWMFQSPGSLCALGQHLEGNWWLEQNLEDLWNNIMKWQLCLSAASQLSHFNVEYG